MGYDVTHTHNAGRVPMTVEAQSLEWDYTVSPAVLRIIVPRVGDGAPLSAEIPVSRVVRVVRPDDAPEERSYRSDSIAPTESAAQHARRVERENRRTIPAGNGSGVEDIAEWWQ